METQAPAQVEVRDEAGYARARDVLTRKHGFAADTLRSLMRAFEAYRAARKIGWSRPWNKSGLVTFRTLEFHPARDRRALELAVRFARRAGGDMVGARLSELASCPAARGFLFLHDRPGEGGARLEGFTLSFGRVSALSRRHRDRFDVVVERVWPEHEPVRGAGGVLLRVYDDPYDGATAFPEPQVTALALDDETLASVAEGLALARAYGHDSARHWSHWTQEYIDSFGPRAAEPSASWFPSAPGGEIP